jgi:hypothetical protein
MMEPRRLLEQGATGLELALLRSARADVPPEGAAERVAMALGGVTLGLGATHSQAAGHAQFGSSLSGGAPAAAQAVKLGVLAKLGLVALVGVGAVGGGSIVHFMNERGSGPTEMSGPRAPEAEHAPVPRGENLPGTLRELPAATRAEVTGQAQESEDLPGRANPAGVDESLRAEIRVLDLARAAVDARDPTAAQHALDGYARRFPQGHLRPEAAVLRLAVLVQQGNRPAARALGAKLLSSQSSKAYEQRIHSLLRDLGE